MPAKGGSDNSNVYYEKDKGSNPKSQSHVVQRPGSSAVPLCRHSVTDVVGFTSRDGIDESSDSKWQAATEHGEDGVAQIVIDRVLQRALSHVDSGLDGDRDRLPWVLLAHRVWLLIVHCARLLVVHCAGLLGVSITLLWVSRARLSASRGILVRWRGVLNH